MPLAKVNAQEVSRLPIPVILARTNLSLPYSRLFSHYARQSLALLSVLSHRLKTSWVHKSIKYRLSPKGNACLAATGSRIDSRVAGKDGRKQRRQKRTSRVKISSNRAWKNTIYLILSL